MNAERWKQIDELFDAVLEIPHDRREAFLLEKCGGDEELKMEVLSLIAAQKETERFLEKPAMNVAAQEFAHNQTTIVDFAIVGRMVGNYHIERQLGAGGMGEVYLATDTKLKRLVALKILPAAFVLDDERIKRFEREARAVSVLNHPNIVTIYDFGQADGINYIATEYIEGTTLRELIGGDLKLKDTLQIVAQCCEALAAAHKENIIHRDIKPENIMVRPDGYVKILDFGLAKLTDLSPPTFENLAQTAKGVIIGTPAYMSPEQVADERVDHRTDLWSIGVVLYELITGKNPFKRGNRQTTFQAILSEDAPPPSFFNEEVSAELDSILLKALEKDPDLSYQTASDLRADLKRVKRELDSSPSWSRGSERTKSEKIQTVRKMRLAYAFPVFLFLLLIVAGYFYWQLNFVASAADWKRAKNIQLTDQSGAEIQPSLAPDGESFIFSAKNGGRSDIFLQRVGGKNATNLTPDSPDNDTQPAYSPDGKLIVFHSDRQPAGIYVMEATGENPRRICKTGNHPSWSPDGKEIVVSEVDQEASATRNPSSLLITTVATGEQRVLIEGWAAQPNWSPHGQRIAFWMIHSGGKRDVATIPATGGEPVMVTTSIGTNWNPVWSPDGNYLYFASDRGGNMAFWRVAINEATGKVLSEPEGVSTPAKFNRHLSFSRDGKRLIYVQTDKESNLKAVKFDGAKEKIVGEPFWITRREQEVVRPEISPDGKQFVMRLARLTQNDIVLVNSDGNGWRDLTNDEFSENYPRWSPDGRQIAYVSDRSGNYEIWTMNADGTNSRQWTFGNQSSASYPIWSPDGSRICYDFNHKAYILDLTKPANEQKPQELPGSEEYSFVIVWDWSPDGKKLAGMFSDKNGGLIDVGYYSFETRRWEKLLDVPTFNMLWLSDSSRIVYYRQNKAYLVDIAAKKEREILTLSQEQLSSVAVTRNEDLLYYTVSSSESDIWLLDLARN